MIKTNNYDPIAKLYDGLSYLVFGNAQRRVQTALLANIPAGCRILIAGGGTGWILEKLSKLYPSGLDITYVEISQKMIALSQRRNVAQNIVHFVNKPIELYKASEAFDVVITGFLFDNFSEEHAKNAFSHIDSLLRPGGLWLMAEFDAEQSKQHVWQRLMLSVMYSFFRLVCKIEAKDLVSVQQLFNDKGYKLRSYIKTYGEFIFSALYEKQSSAKEAINKIPLA